ncbi:MAG TPA: YggS family pyridoxal phosphate-dependent enzyme [Flavobacteriaceae bacterium]|nr:YggS family pyridoxal phosphate-dependent enzyme [Flavobacteriaceae bacterium]
MADITLKNIEAIEQRIVEACIKSGRKPEDVKLLLATKTVSAERIRTVINQGYTLIGENKIQEAMAKQEVLKELPIEWHFIGHLQTNKVKFITQFTDVVQSIDRLRLASKLQNRLVYDKRKSMDVFIQVNTSFEASKFGVPPEKALELIKQVSELPRLNIKGLMTIGILSSKDDKVRDCFKLLKEIQLKAQELSLPNASFDELSMGMSNDLELAIEEGSTMIRVGTAIFGKRAFPDSYYWNEG